MSVSLIVKRRINTYDRLAARHGWTKVQIKSESDIRVHRQRYKRLVVVNNNSNNSTGNITIAPTSNSIADGDGDQHQRQEQEFVVLDLWPTTGTVGSYLRHPRQNKKTQLFRKECTDEDLLDQIFQDPRTHTDKGYYKKRDSSQRVPPPPSSQNRSIKNENNIKGEIDNDDRRVDLDRKRTRPVSVPVVEENDARMSNGGDNYNDENEEDMGPRQPRKRRRVACHDGQKCRNWNCPYSHSPRCFFGPRCWFQPNCWFDHTHGLCHFGEDCFREDCWFSHRNPNFYYWLMVVIVVVVVVLSHNNTMCFYEYLHQRLLIGWVVILEERLGWDSTTQHSTAQKFSI